MPAKTKSYCGSRRLSFYQLAGLGIVGWLGLPGSLQASELLASDGASNDRFGGSVSLSGQQALVGAILDDDSGTSSGSAYFFKGLDTAGASVTQNTKLTASDGAASDEFGFSVSLSGNQALVGAGGDDDNGFNSGSAYFFKDLDTAGASVTENTKLNASDGAASDLFGSSVSLSGNQALVGADRDDDNGSSSGSAYFFKSLNTAGASVTQNTKLTASDGAGSDLFGFSVSLSGNQALVGARLDDDSGSDSGSAYFFKDLDTAGASVTEDVKLTASDGAASDLFGDSVSLSGNQALVGAARDDDNGSNSGSAYLFKDLDTAGANVTEDVKLTASDGVADDLFGSGVALDGDRFLIGALRGDGAVADSGKAYSGTVSSVTTLDEGNASRRIDGISFVSQVDWIVGENTDFNEVTLGADDAADVTAAGKAVYLGQNAGSDGNTLILEGSLTATEVRIGSESGNAGNTLQIAATGSGFDVAVFYLAADNFLEIEGDFTTAGDLLTYLDDSDLMVENGSGLFEQLTSGNFASLVATSFDGSFTSVSAVPEPASFSLLAGLLGLFRIALRRRARA